MQATNGQAIINDQKVALPGTPIEMGDQLTVLDHPVSLVSTTGQSFLWVQPDSRLRLDYAEQDPPRYYISIEAGGGALETSGTHFIFDPGSPKHKINEGTATWTMTENALNFQRSHHPNFSPRYLQQKTQWKQNPIKRKEQWFVGSLEPERKVSESIRRYHQKRGQWPGSLREVFGYWVRDRFGQVYLYRHDGKKFTVESAGRDGKFTPRQLQPFNRN